MSGTVPGATAAPSQAGAPHAVRTLVLGFLAGDASATRTELGRHLAPFLTHKLSALEQRAAINRAVADLVEQKLATDGRGRTTLTAAGRATMGWAPGDKQTPRQRAEARGTWLVAVALGLEKEPARRRKSLARPEGLSAAILQQAFAFKLKGSPSPARLRSELAVIALERAFGNTMKLGLGSGAGLSAKAGRLLAGQLARRPRDFRTDSRLVTALAAEQVGAGNADLDSLRAAVLRRFVDRALEAGPAPAAVQVTPPAITPAPAAPRSEARPAPRPAAATRPDLLGFARAVQMAARVRAEGWPGSRKAFISHVWRALDTDHPEWGLTTVEFKGMLAEAHRTGHVTLANADLKDKRTLKDVQDSAVVYKNSVLHFVRVDD